MENILLLQMSFGVVLGIILYFQVANNLSRSLRFLVVALSRSRDGLQAFVNKITSVIQDFRSGRYYKPWRQKGLVVIQSLDHIRELSDSPQLSQRAVYSDIFGFQYTMHHAQTNLDPTEQTPMRYKLFATAIRGIGVAQIMCLQPYLQSRLEGTLHEHLDSVPKLNGWTTVKLAPLMRSLAGGLLGTYFFGDALYDEPEFHAATFDYYRDVINCMGALQVTPSFAKGTVYNLITKKGHSLHVLFERMLRVINEGVWQENEPLKSITLLHNMIEQTRGSTYWTPDTLVQAIIGIWFAASHQPWINLHFIFLELCSRPEYVKLLREEISAQKSLDYATITRLPILDSFIKESVRLNPLDKMAIRRKALSPYTFSNGGPHIATGEIACISAYNILHNEAKYPRANEFDGLRFVKNRPDVTGTEEASQHSQPMRGTTFTDASKDFPIWGFGARVCPGRWHADLVLKMVIVQLVAHYEFRLEDASARQKWWWETFQMPYESTRVMFRRREG